MNFIILISFVVFILTVIIAMFPKIVALRIAGINRYDLQTTPKVIVYAVFIGSILLMTVSLIIFLQEVNAISLPFPTWLELEVSLGL